jgi:hypothetical protein
VFGLGDAVLVVSGAGLFAVVSRVVCSVVVSCPAVVASGEVVS